jgi:hypothetical protein
VKRLADAETEHERVFYAWPVEKKIEVFCVKMRVYQRTDDLAIME